MAENKQNDDGSQRGKRNYPLIIFEIGLLGLIVIFLIFADDWGIGREQDASDAAGSNGEFNVDRDGLIPADVAGAVQVGKDAPDFTLLNVNGEQKTLSELRGQPINVVGYATKK